MMDQQYISNWWVYEYLITMSALIAGMCLLELRRNTGLVLLAVWLVVQFSAYWIWA